MRGEPLRVSATEFKARCLSIFKSLESRRFTRVVVTRRGKPVAEITPPSTAPPDPWGALRGSVTIGPGVNLTAPVLKARITARRGVLHR